MLIRPLFAWAFHLTNPFLSIWYQFCLLSLLLPFVRDATSLSNDGQQPANERVPPNVNSLLPGDATPFSVCNESSEALIMFASNYHNMFFEEPMSPLLPYMLFTAVLYRLTLIVNPPFSNPPTPTSSATGLSNHRVSNPNVWGYPQLTLQRGRLRDNFLVERGSQVLEYCGNKHSGAASAAHMLRSLGRIEDLMEGSVNLADMAHQLPPSASLFTRLVTSTVCGYAASPVGAVSQN